MSSVKSCSTSYFASIARNSHIYRVIIDIKVYERFVYIPSIWCAATFVNRVDG